MGDNNALLIKGSVFVKFQKSCIIEKTQQGSIYMNSLQQFRKLYKDSGDETIGDPYEGKLYIYNADCFIPDKGHNEHLSNYALQKKMKMILFIVFLTVILISTIFFNLEMK